MRVALRYDAAFLPIDKSAVDVTQPTGIAGLAMAKQLAKTGYSASEELLHAFDLVPESIQTKLTSAIDKTFRVNLNWTPLVKGWLTPTNETYGDHLVTAIANLFPGKIKGTELPCGHIIPDGTFPLERYNGCPFCGTPFVTNNTVFTGQASKLKELRLFTLTDMDNIFRNLLESAVPLDATQRDSFNILLKNLDIPEGVNIAMKETAILVVANYLERGDVEKTFRYMQSPIDVMRYLWYFKTGQVQIVEPKTLVHYTSRLYNHLVDGLDRSQSAKDQMKNKLKLKYGRKDCRIVAKWFNAMPMAVDKMAEIMNPKREMWVRFIRALRLGEYAKRQGFERLGQLLDIFYRKDYEVWGSSLDKARQTEDSNSELELLKLRPGQFARSLYATMLRLGPDQTLTAFAKIAEKIPARLLLSLANGCENYFCNETGSRIVKPLGGIPLSVDVNRQLLSYNESERYGMIIKINRLFLSEMKRRYAASGAPKGGKVYIAPELYRIPLSVGDRSDMVQEASSALMGTRFPVKGTNVRLFLQWGEGLHAQHLDMDLSCRVLFTNPNHTPKDCAYYALAIPGCRHSGDIRSIPEMVGTAEYIDLDLDKLTEVGASQVIFTCNAYSTGGLSPNLVVGWMNSEYPMVVSEATGVAYDPSCVQHMIKITKSNLAKGLVFGVLDVARREIIWLELPNTTQCQFQLNNGNVEKMLDRLDKKLKVGQLLSIRAEALGQTIVQSPDEESECYTLDWAKDSSAVTRLIDL